MSKETLIRTISCDCCNEPDPCGSTRCICSKSHVGISRIGILIMHHLTYPEPVGKIIRMRRQYTSCNDEHPDSADYHKVKRRISNKLFKTWDYLIFFLYDTQRDQCYSATYNQDKTRNKRTEQTGQIKYHNC